jgi:hypothetical protein
MDTRTAITIVINNTRVVAHFITNLAITLIQKCVTKVLEMPIRPVYGPDTTFKDPVTAKVFNIQGETTLTLTYAGQQRNITAYVVSQNDISKSILLGMDSLLAMQRRLLKKRGRRANQPHFPNPGRRPTITNTTDLCNGADRILRITRLAKAILVRHRTLPSTISSRFSDKYHLQIGGTGSTASRSTASWHPKRPLQCVNHKHQHPVYPWIELLKAIQLPYRIPRVQNYLATDSCGPPSTPPLGYNQRFDMPKMPSSGPPALTVHGPTTPGRKEPGSQGY